MAEFILDLNLYFRFSGSLRIAGDEDLLSASFMFPSSLK